MNKCIRMGITILKIVIWGSKSSDLQSHIPLFQLQNCRFTSPNDNFQPTHKKKKKKKKDLGGLKRKSALEWGFGEVYHQHSNL